MICKYCERNFKNKHGVHIHWFYCLVKGFSEMPIEIVGPKEYVELMEDARLISIFRYPTSFINYIADGEFGMKFNKRYSLRKS